MDIQVEGKQMDVGESLTQHVSQHLTDIVSKYFPQALTAHVVFSKEPHGSFHVDVTLHPTHGVTLHNKESAADAYAAFDAAIHHLSEQLRREHGKHVNHHGGHKRDKLSDHFEET